MILSLALAEEVITPQKSNYLPSRETVKLLQRLHFPAEFIATYQALSDKEYRDQDDWGRCFLLYNQLHLNSLKLNQVRVTNTYLASTLSKVCNIQNNVTVSCSKIKASLEHPRIKIISCAGFMK